MLQSVGTALGSITGYAIDSLSSFLDSAKPNSSPDPAEVNNAIEPTTNTSSENVSVVSQLRNLQVPKDPFLSPLHADDAMIKKLPPVALVVSYYF